MTTTAGCPTETQSFIQLESIQRDEASKAFVVTFRLKGSAHVVTVSAPTMLSLTKFRTAVLDQLGIYIESRGEWHGWPARVVREDWAADVAHAMRGRETS